MKMLYCKNGYTGEEAVVVAVDEGSAHLLLGWNDFIITDEKEIKAIIIAKEDPSHTSRTSDQKELLI